MRKQIIIELAVGIIILTALGFGAFTFLESRKVPSPKNALIVVEEKQKEKMEMANPASVYCQKNGGKLEIRTAEDGSQIGYCKFSEGIECEEWAFMRGECSKDITESGVDTTNWKTYKNEKIGIELQYPSEWKPGGDIRLNSECLFMNNKKGNIVDIFFRDPRGGGLFVEGVDKKECTNRGIGEYHYAKNFSEIKYNEQIDLGENKFYLYFERTPEPGAHAFHAVLFGNLKVVPSIHIYYVPAELTTEKNMSKEYQGSEEEYKNAKNFFIKILSTIKFY